MEKRGKPMKRQFFIIMAIFLFTGVISSINAQDLIVLRDGNIIEAKVLEISSSEIKYKRFTHLDGPTIVVQTSDVLSIRYENGTVDVFNTVPALGQPSAQQNQPTALQRILNELPAIRIAGNSLKFEFIGESWVARVNGENFTAGTIEFEGTEEGGILTLRQTHIWPGAVGRTAGRIASSIPGGGAVGNALTTAGDVAGTLGAIETTGTIVLEYKAGPPASLRFVSSSGGQDPTIGNDPSMKTANVVNNWLSLEPALFGIGARYERMLGSKISIGANVYWWPWSIIYWQYFEADAFFRFYPWGKTFFLGAGFGYYRFINIEHFILYGSYYSTVNAFSITPEIGWKIDLGNAGGFY
jgi:hypothetical protein